MQPSTLAKRLWLALFIAIGAFYVWGLGSVPLVGPDEPRYAEVAREMFMRRDWITPTLGGLPWFEKPPLLYWMAIAGYRVFGVNEFAARLGPALCGLVTAVFVYLIGRAMPQDSVRESGRATAEIENSGVGRWSAFVFLSSFGAIAFSRGANFDIVLTMTVTGAFASFFIFHRRAEHGTITLPLIGFNFFTGASLLAKGLAGYVIIFGALVVYYLIRRQWPQRRFIMSFLWGLPLSFAIAAIWYGPMIARHGYTFIDQFIIQHHFERFATNRYHHPQPFYFYLATLVALTLPWTVALVAALFSTRRWRWRGIESIDVARVLLCAWLVLPIVFFSLSRSKLPGYILPVLPACALLSGERIACFIRERRGEKVIRATGVLLVILSGVAAWYASRNYDVESSRVVTATFLPLFIGLLAAIRPKLREIVFVAIGIAVIASSALSLRLIGPAAATTESVRELIASAGALGYGSVPVVQLHTIERTAEFYAAGRLSYGRDGEPVKLEGANQVLDAARLNSGHVLCFVPLMYLSQLTALPNADCKVIASNGRVCLVLVSIR